MSVRILTISSTPYLTIVSARLTPVNATVQMIRQELIFVSIIMITFGTRAGYGDLTPHLKAAKPDE